MKTKIKIFALLFILFILFNCKSFAISKTVENNTPSVILENTEDFLFSEVINSKNIVNNNYIKQKEVNIIEINNETTTKNESRDRIKLKNLDRIESENIVSALNLELNSELYNLDFVNLQNVYIPTNNEYDYYISSIIYVNGNNYTSNFKIIKHNIIENQNEVIYTFDGLFSMKHYVRNNTIYIEGLDYNQYAIGDCSGVRIIGFDLDKNEEVYNNFFEDAIVKKNDEFHTFVVDSKEKVYFEYEYTGMKIYDKNGSLVYDRVPIQTQSGDREVELVLHSITPNDDGIIFSIGEYSFLPQNYIRTLYQGYQKLNERGTPVYQQFTLFENKGNSYYILDPNWSFITDNGEYAIDQYGNLAKFTYLEENNENMCGIKIDILDSTNRVGIDSYYGQLKNPVYCINNNYLYMFSSEGIITVFDINNNYKRIGKYETGILVEDNVSGKIYRIACINDRIFIHYYDIDSNKNLENNISLNELEEFKNIWITKNKTQNYTQKEISLKYMEALPKYDYKLGLYEKTPTWTSPYTAGKLKQGPIDDTLNQINFYRWLYGVDEVTVNYDKMERSQKGAVVQAATNELTHYPKQPQDMDDDFYAEAYAACNASANEGDMYNGNCASGDENPANTISGFIDEMHNVSQNSNVGHRLNLLDLYVDRTSFGYCNRYTALSMYYPNQEKTYNFEEFYAYPIAGNFPMQLFKTNQYISFLLVDTYDIRNLKIEFIYNDKTYPQDEFHIENQSAVVFLMPDELQQEINNESNEMKKCSITVKIMDLKRGNGDTINFSYNTEFYDVNTPEEDYKLGDVSGDGIVNATDYTMIIRYIKGYEELNSKQLLAADVNKDKTVNATDYTIIIRYIKGYETL